MSALISISVVGGGASKDINIESLLPTKTDQSTTVPDSCPPPSDIHRIFQASSGISIKKQSDELETRLTCSEEVSENNIQEEEVEEECDDDPEPVVNEARQYDVCIHGDLSEYSCADCSYNRWRSERDFARKNSKKWRKTKSKIIEEVDWYEVFKMPDAVEQEIPEENDNLVVPAPVEKNIEAAKQNANNYNGTKKVSQDIKETKKEKKIKNGKQKIGDQVKDSDQIKELKEPDSANAAESKGSLGGTVQEVVANSAYFSKFPKQIKKGPTLDDRFLQDPTLPAGWLVREFSLQCRKNGRTDKEYRAPDCMVFRSKKSIIEYMKYVGLQPDQKCL